MRVIAGMMKGRKLKAVPGKETRPTTDKVKESVFQMMGPFFDGGNCLDLFAGSGGLGIEALSRGMTSAVFVDKQQSAVQTLRDNIAMLGIEDQTEVFRADAFRALQAAAKRELVFDLILLDPPYKKVDYERLVREICALGLIGPDGIIYCEHDPAEKLPVGDDFLHIIKQIKISNTIAITIFRKVGEERTVIYE